MPIREKAALDLAEAILGKSATPSILDLAAKMIQHSVMADEFDVETERLRKDELIGDVHAGPTDDARSLGCAAVPVLGRG